MSQLISITVLAPNGRRQTVKVSSNSTILQILEDVCAKQGFDPLEYDIRHHSRILDTTQTVQFSRLPNNAQLEMVKAKTLRKESEVLISLQLESGERLTGTFLPTDSLWDVIVKLNPHVESDKQPSMQYMRQEIHGEDSLKNRTLRSLGLTSGRVLFRFTNRFPVEDTIPSGSQPAASSVQTQQLGASSKTPPPQVVSSSVPNQSKTVVPITTQPQQLDTLPTKTSQFNRSSPSPPPQSSIVKPAPQTSSMKMPVTKASTPISGNTPKVNERTSQVAHSSKKLSSLEEKILAEIRESKGSPKRSGVESQKGNAIINLVPDSSTSKKSVAKSDSLKTTKSSEPSKKTPQELSTAVTSLNIPEEPSSSLLGTVERTPILYNRTMQQRVSSEDLPDEFFELTIDDVKYLYRDMKSRISDTDEVPLQTSALRKLEESKRILNQLHKYKRTVLRIEFPDQNVLQGIFSSVESVENVYEFVREYLEDPTIPFYLYTTPPKNILPLTAKLIEANCVPCAVLHFGVHGVSQDQTHFLKKKVLTNLTSLEKASAAAFQTRGLRTTVENNFTGASTSGSTSEQKESGSQNLENANSAKGSGNPNGKVPKWFKLAPK